VKKEVLEEDIVANEMVQGWERSSDDAQNELNPEGVRQQRRLQSPGKTKKESRRNGVPLQLVKTCQA
jgi:hypothetical protein